MTKKRTVATIMALAMITALTLVYNTPRTEYMMGDRITLASDVTKLNDVSDLVVVAEVMPGKENVIVKNELDGHAMFGYTKTNLAVTTVISGKTDTEAVSITEEYYTSAELTSKVIWISGSYRPAEVGKEYIFYLKKYPDTSMYKGMYYPVDLEKGKYILPSKTEIFKTADDLDISSKTNLKEYLEWYQYVIDSNKDFIN